MQHKNNTRGRIHLRPPVAYYGGKQTLLPVILPMIPEHTRYVEPFLGGGAVYWSKEPSQVEIINDLDGFVINFYQVVKTDFDALKMMIDATPYARESHQKASAIRQSQEFFTPLQCAWAFFILANSSMYAVLDNQCLFPGRDIKVVATFYNKANRFGPVYTDRLRNTFVERREALYVIDQNDGEQTFFFIDPPYFNSNMGHYGGYTETDFEALLKALSNVKGKFILTCYPSELLDLHLGLNPNWEADFRDMAKSAGSKGKRKTEVLVRNY
jgi:DNA adenine methylase